MSLRVLASARDPGAAGHVEALWRELDQTPGFEITVWASGAALEALNRSGCPCRPFVLPGGGDHVAPGESPNALLRAAREILDRVRPHLVLTSLSSFGAGLDEALLHQARVPTFAIQDFWGDANHQLGVFPDRFLVMDEDAARLTAARWPGASCLITGPLKYAAYQRLSPLRLRRETRARLGISPETRLVGWFAQSPTIPGHQETFAALVQALAARGDAALVVRGHPKFPDLARRGLALAGAAGLTVLEGTASGRVEPLLATCDVVTTPFSSCGLDHAYLSAVSPAPLGTVLYLLTDPRLAAFARQATGLERLPLVDRGLGRWVTEPADLVETLDRALTDVERQNYHAAAAGLPWPDFSALHRALAEAGAPRRSR